MLKEIIEKFKENKDKMDLSSHIDFKFADYDLLLEVYRDVMVFAACKQYKERRKYNLQQLGENHNHKNEEESEEEKKPTK